MYCIVKDHLFLVYIVKVLGGVSKIIIPLKFDDILPLSHSLSVVHICIPYPHPIYTGYLLSMCVID